MVDDESWGRSGHLFDILFLNIVDFHFFIVPAFGVVGGQSSCLLEYPVWKFFSFAFYNDVGAWDALGVEPSVVSSGQLEGQLFVLVIILSHINMEAVGGQVVEGFAYYLLLFHIGAMFFNEAVFCQLHLNLG